MALVAGNVSAQTVSALSADGWRVHRVHTIPNPGRWQQGTIARRGGASGGATFPARFWGVYTKLLVFNLTQYERGDFILYASLFFLMYNKRDATRLELPHR